MTTRRDDQGSMRPGSDEIQPAYGNPQPRRPGQGRQRQGIMETIIKSFIRSIAGSLGRAIMRMIVGRR